MMVCFVFEGIEVWMWMMGMHSVEKGICVLYIVVVIWGNKQHEVLLLLLFDDDGANSYSSMCVVFTKVYERDCGMHFIILVNVLSFFFL